MKVEKVFPYRIVIQYSTTEGQYVARAPALGITAAAETLVKAAEKIQQMGETLVAGMMRAGRKLPLEPGV